MDGNGDNERAGDVIRTGQWLGDYYITLHAHAPLGHSWGTCRLRAETTCIAQGTEEESTRGSGVQW